MPLERTNIYISTCLERRSPAHRVDECSVEGAEVDQSVGGEVEVGDEWRNGVQISDEKECYRHDESQHVAAVWFVVLAVAFREEENSREDSVVAQSLNQARN